VKLIGGTPGLIGTLGKVIGFFSPASGGVFYGMIILRPKVKAVARFLGIPVDRIAMISEAAPFVGSAGVPIGIPGNFFTRLIRFVRNFFTLDPFAISFLVSFTIFFIIWHDLGDLFQVVPFVDLDPPLPRELNPDWLSLGG